MPQGQHGMGSSCRQMRSCRLIRQFLVVRSRCGCCNASVRPSIHAVRADDCLPSAIFRCGCHCRVQFVLLLVKAWEFDVPLRVVALRGSVPGAWPSDFKAVSGKHARLAYEQRAQLTDIYSELTVGRCGACPCMLCF